MSQRLERSEALNDWNVLNGLRYYLAIERLEHLEQAQAQLALWFVEYRDASVATVNNVVCVTALLPSGSSRHEAPLTRVEEAYQRKVACPLFSPLEHFLTTATCTITVANDLASHAPSENEVSKHRKHIPTVIYFAALLTNLLVSCSLHGAEPSPAAQTEWSNALKKAYEEGQLTVYGSTKYDLLFAEFQKQYPQIKVTVSTTRGSDVISRLMAERRADRYLVDLHLGSANASYLLYKAKIVDRLKPALMLAEITDESKWWGARHRYLDSEREYIFSFDGEAQMLFAYNTNLVNPNDLKSLWDFLDPKWKGRIVGLDPTNPIGIGVGLRFLYYNPDLGAPFLRKLLGEMELAASRDTRQIGDWLAVGNYALSVFTDPTRTGLDVAKKQGLPVDWFGPKAFREGVPLSSSTGNVALMDKAPHPAAARIAINWLLSRNGQSAYQRVFKEPDSLRIDVPKDAVPPESRRTADAKYVDIDRADRMDMEPIFKIVDEVWKKGKRG